MKRFLWVSVAGLAALAACTVESRDNDDDDDGTSTSTTTTSGSTGGSGGAGGSSTTTAVTTTAVTTTAVTTSSVATTGVGGQGGAMPCLDSSDCGAGIFACDPQDQTCGGSQCSAAAPCPSGEICLEQASSAGACYTACVPGGAGCAAGEDCLDVGGVGTSGACFANGPAGFHQACTFHDTNDGCVAGHVCVDDGLVEQCLELCNYWGAAGSCVDPNEYCLYVGVCYDPGGFDPAPIGQFCGAAAAEGDWCGLSGEELQGVCIDTGSASYECLKICRAGMNDCDATQQCFTFGGEPVGVCF